MIIEVIAKTRASCNKVVPTKFGKVVPKTTIKTSDKSDNSLTVYTTQPANNNRANLSIIDQLAEYFDVAKKAVSIKSGLKSKRKIFEILISN